MPRRLLILSLIPSLLAPAFAAEGGNVTLRQCYEWARAQDEGLKSRREDVVQSQARARAAIGSALPDVSWEMTRTHQDPDGVEELESKGFAGFVEQDQTESKFSAKQPLFSGLREFSARSGFKRQSAADAMRLERAELELFQRTSEAFYGVLEEESAGANTRDALLLSEDRVKDLQRFKRLGKSRESEVFTAQARASALKAQSRRLESRVASAREDLSVLTGQDLSTRKLSDDAPAAPRIPSLQDALSAARQRSDLRALAEEEAAARLRVRYARGSYWPSADLTGNYYTKRPAFMDAISWDVIFSVRVPLFRGGASFARTDEALSALRQASFRREEAERQVASRVRRLHAELSAAVQESEALEDAASAAQKSYDALQSEYRLGLVTNLEVLAALDTLLEQTSARDAARLKVKRLAVQLGVAMEKMP